MDKNSTKGRIITANRSVVIYGGEGSGKTRYASNIMNLLRLDVWIDDFNPHSHHEIKPYNHLYMTGSDMVQGMAEFARVEFMHIETVLKLMGVQTKSK